MLCYQGEKYISHHINVIKENKNIYHIINVIGGRRSHHKCYEGEYISHHEGKQEYMLSRRSRIYITS